MDSKLQGKTAVIVGAEGGLGKALAFHFASLGCSLALVGKNQTKLDDIAQNCVDGQNSKQALGFTCDPQEETNVENLFSRISNQLGSLHILVNCETSISYGLLSAMTPSTINNAMQTNTLATVVATKAATSYLEQTGGVVINISCSCAHRTSPGLTAFGMAMSSINYFTQSAAMELAPRRVRANAVSPSVNVFESLLDTPQDKPYQEPRTAPLNQAPPTVDDVLKTITYLASDESSFITGEIICIDNGLHIAGVPF